MSDDSKKTEALNSDVEAEQEMFRRFNAMAKRNREARAALAAEPKESAEPT